MKRPPTVDILRALDDPKLFRGVLRDPATWRPWRAFLAALYGVHRIEGDRYAGQWPVEAFRKQRIEYVAAAKTKSDIYVSLLPAINSRRCDLLDDAKLISELAGLERRTARGGRDSIDHRPGFHDDTVNAAAGAIVALFEQAGPVVIPQELLGRIMAMPKRRSFGSNRSPQTLFAFGNAPPLEQQGYGPHMLRHLKV